MEADDFNQDAWDRIANENDRWFTGATQEEIALAKSGQWRVKITPTKEVPADWMNPVRDRDVLLLAGGGGKQGPILAAAGARVTVIDFSAQQLERDQKIASQHGLELSTIQCDINNLDGVNDDSFDLVLNPTSVCYCPDLNPIWNEAFRVTRPGGCFVTGLINPVNYLFDFGKRDRGQLIARHTIRAGQPYRDDKLPDDELATMLAPNRPMEFGHSLSDMIAGQLDAGFVISGFYTDRWGGKDKLSEYIDVFLATRAFKPG